MPKLINKWGVPVIVSEAQASDMLKNGAILAEEPEVKTYDVEDPKVEIHDVELEELKQKAKELKIPAFGLMKKETLTQKIKKMQTE